MPSLNSALSPRRRFVWLLWLMLLLPLAQTASALHVLSHATSAVAGGSGKVDGEQAIDSGHCNLCLMAAALMGAAPPGTGFLLAQSIALCTQPTGMFTSVWLAPALPVYESRAPPFSVL